MPNGISPEGSAEPPNDKSMARYLKESQLLGPEKADELARRRANRKGLLDLPAASFVHGIATGGIPPERILGPLGLATLATVTFIAARHGLGFVEKGLDLADRLRSRSKPKP